MSTKEIKAYMTQATLVFGKNMAVARRSMGYTQQDLAMLIPCDKNMISQWETGERLPMDYYKLRIAQVLGVSTDYLWGRSADVEGDQTQVLFGAAMMQLHETSKVMMQKLANGLIQKVSSTLPSNETYLFIDVALKVIQAVDKMKGISPDVLEVKAATHEMRGARNFVISRVDQLNRNVARSISDAIEHNDKNIGHLLLWEQTERVSV